MTCLAAFASADADASTPSCPDGSMTCFIDTVQQHRATAMQSREAPRCDSPCPDVQGLLDTAAGAFWTAFFTATHQLDVVCPEGWANADALSACAGRWFWTGFFTALQQLDAVCPEGWANTDGATACAGRWFWTAFFTALQQLDRACPGGWDDASELSLCADDTFWAAMFTALEQFDPIVDPIANPFEDPLASGGDAADGQEPSYTNCWDILVAPFYGEIDSADGFHVPDFGGYSAASGCGSPRNGGVTVYYPRAYMKPGYAHSGNFNHKSSNWLHSYKCTDGNTYFCAFKTYLTNSRNRVISGYTYTGNGPGFIGHDWGGTKAARPYCMVVEKPATGGVPPSELVNCYYSYG